LYKASFWPAPEVISPLVHDDQTFLIIYRDLYYRHIFQNIPEVTIEHRLDAFRNYIDFFDLLLSLSTERPEVDLPTVWLWDLVNDFVSQYASFHSYRCTGNHLDKYESKIMRNAPHAWSTTTILRYLQAIVDKSAGSQAVLYVALSQFAIIGQMRVNCLLADYLAVLSLMDGIDITGATIVQEVIGAHCSLYYILGLSYFMLRRYTDASKTLNYFLMYAERNPEIVPQGTSAVDVPKLSVQMGGLLGMCARLCPVLCSDEAIVNIIEHHHSEQYRDLFGRDTNVMEEAFSDLFYRSTPLFVNPAPPNYSAKVDTQNAMARLQLRVLLSELRQRIKASELGAHLKLCKSVSVANLAAFLQQTDKKTNEASVTRSLLCLKHKTRTLRWNSEGGASGGNWSSAAAVDFAVEDGVVTLVEHKKPRSYADFFIRNAIKLDDLVRELQAM